MALSYNKEKHKNIKYFIKPFDGEGYLYFDLDTNELIYSKEKIHEDAKVIQFMGNEMQSALDEAKEILEA